MNDGVARARWDVLPFDGKVHDRSTFSCGAPEPDRYVREYASQDVKRDLARAFVAVEPGSPIVAAYYTLSATSFKRASLPEEQARRLPGHPVPTVLLGRLAVDETRKGRGLGTRILVNAMVRVLSASRIIAVQALTVNARDEVAVAFYRRYGFISFKDDKHHMFLPLASIRKLVRR